MQIRRVYREEHIGFSVTCATPSGPEPSRVPNEIWECIIDLLRDEPKALTACMFVCKTWHSRSLQHLKQYSAGLNDRNTVLRFARFAQEVNRRWNGATIRGSKVGDGKAASLSHITLFAAMLTGRSASSMKTLALQKGEWQASAVPQSVFLHLSTFSSITRLRIRDVTFPSIAIFGRLVCSFMGLTELSLRNVFFSSGRASVPIRSPRATPPNLHDIHVLWLDDPVPSEVYQALSATRIIQFCHRVHDDDFGRNDIPLRCIQDMGLQHALRCAGSSLQYVALGFGNSLMETGMDMAGSQQLVDNYINISRNTNLQQLKVDASLKLQTIKSSHLYWLPRLLSHVSARSIQEIVIELEQWGWRTADRRITWEDVTQDAVGLTQICGLIDDLISLPRYTDLKSVVFSFCLPYDRTDDKTLRGLKTYMIRMCPKLHTRGILDTNLWARHGM